MKVTATIEADFTVRATWDAKVDHPHAMAWSTAGNKKLAERLARAINAQVVFTNPVIKKTVDGETYVSAEHHVMGRYMNADLKKLGY